MGNKHLKRTTKQRLRPRLKIVKQLKQDIWGQPLPRFWKLKRKKWWGVKGVLGKKRTIRVLKMKGFPLDMEPNEYLLRTERQGKPRAKYGAEAFFSARLKAKKGLQAFYGKMKSKQLLNYYRKSEFMDARKKESLFSQLERRLEAVVLRSGFFLNIFEIRQKVLAGYFMVNGRVTKSPSYQLGLNDVLSVNPKYAKAVREEMTLKNRIHRRRSYRGSQFNRWRAVDVPKYLEVDYASLSAMFVSLPKAGEVVYPSPMNLKLIRQYRP